MLALQRKSPLLPAARRRQGRCVVTGRSRLALFAVRAPAAIALTRGALGAWRTQVRDA
jgi:hypothetical protein